MAGTTKPDLTTSRIWANGATGGDITDPGVPKYTTGWALKEVPTFPDFNFLQQQFTQGLVYNNEQGINGWDTNTVYPIGALVKGSDGFVYRAIVQQNGNDPTADTGANWGDTQLGVNLQTLTITTMSTLTGLVAGKTVVETMEYATGKDGFGVYDVISGTGTANGFNIIAHATLSFSFVLRLFDGIKAQALGIIGDGTTDDSSALTNAQTLNIFVDYGTQTYIFDVVLTVSKVISKQAVFKLKDLATVTGVISDVLVRLSSGGVIVGSLTIDGNKASNQPSPPAIGTTPGVGFLMLGAPIITGTIRVINMWNQGINYPLSNLGNMSGSDVNAIEIDNCSGGAYLNFQNGKGRIGRINIDNMNANYTGVNPHGVDIFFADNADIGPITISNIDGTTAASSGFYSGITCVGTQRVQFRKTTMSDYLSTQLVPLPISILTGYELAFFDTNIRNWSQNRQIECIGCQYVNFIGGSITGAFKETHTGDDYKNTLGFIFTDSAVDNFNNGRDLTTSNNNTVRDFVFENISNPIRDAGNSNKYYNVRAYGGVNGYGTTNIGETAAFYNSGLITGGGDFVLDNCEFSYMEQAGVSANLLDQGAPQLSNVRCNGNGIDTTAFINSRSGIRMDAADQRVVITNYDGRDLASENTGTLNISVPVITFVVDQLFELIHLDGTQKLRAGMRMIITNGLGVGVPLTVRVEGNIKSRDKFGVRAISPTSGTTNPNTSALTGTFSGTSGSNVITGVGSTMRSQITGKQFVRFDGVTYIVAQVTSDTSLIIEGTLSTTFAAVSGTQFISSWTSTATQNRAYHGTYATFKGVQHSGTIEADKTQLTSGFSMGNEESFLSASIAAGANITVPLNRTYAAMLAMQGHTTSSGGLDANSTVAFPTTSSVTVYNWGGLSRQIYVTVKE